MTMRAVMAAAVLAAALAPTAMAQNPPSGQPGRPMPADTPPASAWSPGMMPGPDGRRGDPERMRELRQRIEERWGQMVQQELQLNDQQMDRVRTATRAHMDRRRDLMRRRMDLERAIGQQMQPGVAANNDSLGRMLDAMGRLRVEDAQSDEQLNRDLSFLTPVQRARFFMMQRRFEDRMREIRERRGMGQMRPGERMDPMDERPGRAGQEPRPRSF
jgi:Spy/CpxP family protein refolding chaperone